jgi:hypothetical protein
MPNQHTITVLLLNETSYDAQIGLLQPCAAKLHSRGPTRLPLSELSVQAHHHAGLRRIVDGCATWWHRFLAHHVKEGQRAEHASSTPQPTTGSIESASGIHIDRRQGLWDQAMPWLRSAIRHPLRAHTRMEGTIIPHAPLYAIFQRLLGRSDHTREGHLSFVLHIQLRNTAEKAVAYVIAAHDAVQVRQLQTH